MFQAYTDGHHRVLNSFFPPVLARFVRLQPLSWQGRASVQVQVLGCPVAKATPRSRPPAGVYYYLSRTSYHMSSLSCVRLCLIFYYPTFTAESPPIKVNMGTPRPTRPPTPTEGPVLVETRLSMYMYHFFISHVYNSNTRQSS